MNLLALLMFILIVLTLLMMVLGNILFKKMYVSCEKLSPFECGFSTKFNARLPFSLRFFMVCLIFLIFDVELVLLFPYVMSTMHHLNYLSILLLLLFIMILLVGLIHEWNQGSLDWTQ